VEGRVLGLWRLRAHRTPSGPGEHEAGATVALPGIPKLLVLALSQPWAWATCSCCLGNGKKGAKEADGWEQVSICSLPTQHTRFREVTKKNVELHE
jgi:hypothetical protein